MRLVRPAALLGASALVLLSAPAWAHVTVSSPGARQGGSAVLVFRVPAEGTVATTKLEVLFPANAPIASVAVEPKLGWSYKVTTAKAPPGVRTEHGTVDQVVSRIIWQSAGRGIKPGEFDEFRVFAGRLPRVQQLVFRALQTQKDGDVVRWLETGPGRHAHPAPVLALAPAAGAAVATAGPTPSASPSPVPVVTASPAAVGEGESESEDELELELEDALSIGGAAAGGLALLVALIALVRSGRRL